MIFVFLSRCRARDFTLGRLAIHNMDHKIRKEKHLTEFEIKTGKASHKTKVVSSASLSSTSIRNRNSLFFKNALKMLDTGVVLEIKLVGGGILI